MYLFERIRKFVLTVFVLTRLYCIVYSVYLCIYVEARKPDHLGVFDKCTGLGACDSNGTDVVRTNMCNRFLMKCRINSGYIRRYNNTNHWYHGIILET